MENRNKMKIITVIAVVIFFLGFFFYIPTGMFLAEGIKKGSSLFSNYSYWKVIFRTIAFSFITAIICAAIATPLAIRIVFSPRQHQGKWWLPALIPAIINPLVIIFGMIFLLGDKGPITAAFSVVGIKSILYTPAAVLVGMVYLSIPVMTFFITSSMRTISPDLLTAAVIMGATRFQLYKEIIFPITKRAYFSGGLIVFLMATGYYIIPVLLGGGKSPFAANIIDQLVNRSLDWKTASELSIMLAASIILTILLFTLLKGKRRISHV